jgi:pimeloyl-ACP methyl ester carboxylesterase
MPLVHANGIDLYYEEKGVGTPILCIHGTSSSALVWPGALEELGKRGRCIVYDRRGSFRSERPEPYETTDVSEHADDAAALLDALSATPAIVIGRSYGGETALALAHRYPDKVRALALLEPASLTFDPEAVAWADALKQKVFEAQAHDPASVARVFLGAVAGDDAWDSFPEEIKDMFIGNGPAIMAEFRGKELDLTSHELAQVDQPVLLVSAKDSPEVFQRADEHLVHDLPDAETVMVEGGHLIDPTHPAILDFVDRMIARPRTSRA